MEKIMYEDDVIKKRMHQIWNGMVNRCQNPNHSGYERYGAKGITVSVDWQSFEGFYSDMLNTHDFSLSLNRKDNNKGYSKENCHWASVQLQSVNKGLFKNNTTGFRGVYPSPIGTYRARINVCYKNINLGTYTTKEDAYKSREEAELHYYGFIFSEGLTEDYIEKLESGWIPLAEKVHLGLEPLIGFKSSNSTKNIIQNFGYVDTRKILEERNRKYKYQTTREKPMKQTESADTRLRILEKELEILKKEKEILELISNENLSIKHEAD